MANDDIDHDTHRTIRMNRGIAGDLGEYDVVDRVEDRFNVELVSADSREVFEESENLFENLETCHGHAVLRRRRQFRVDTCIQMPTYVAKKAVKDYYLFDCLTSLCFASGFNESRKIGQESVQDVHEAERILGIYLVMVQTQITSAGRRFGGTGLD